MASRCLNSPLLACAVNDGTRSTISQPVAPVAYQVILKPDIGQFREFESPRECIIV